MLKMFNDNAYRHRHLITLLATYEQFRVYHLIFPCADDDLTGYWSRKEPNPSFELKTIKWVAEQCEGIAEGLHRIHKYQTSSSKASAHEKRYGRHGDLKPENILWFSNDNGGMLMISDFGLAEYSTNHSRSYKHKSRVATSMSYRPPECDLKDGQIGQSYDIWTLGCLYLEFITWLLGGWGLVKEFEKKRMSFDPMWYDMDTDAFFELVQCDKNKRPGVIAAMVKPAVTEVSTRLHSSLPAIQLTCRIVYPRTSRARVMYRLLARVHRHDRR
jgi:serine/threonine protein kinase